MQTKPFLSRVALLSSASFPVLVAAFVSGCAPSFSRSWTCDVQSTTAYSSPPGAQDYDGSGTFTMEVADDGTSIVATRTNGGVGPTCPLHYVPGADGMSGKLGSGQTCKNSVGNSIGFTVGQLKTDGDVITGTYSFTVSGTLANGTALIGQGDAQYTCTRSQ